MTQTPAMTDEADLERLEGLLAKATPGPWEARGCELVGFSTLLATLHWHSGRQTENDADAALIVELRNGAEALIARLRQAQAERDDAYGLGENLADAAEAAIAQTAEWKARAQVAEARNAALEDGLRSARGWIVTCSESATAKRDLKMVDHLLASAS